MENQINNAPLFLHDFALNGIEDLKGYFEIDDAALEGVDILLASYTYGNYEGAAYVLFRKGDQLFEVYGSHCSCYGLEGQWEPEETDIETLKGMVARNPYRIEGCASEFCSLVTQLCS